MTDNQTTELRKLLDERGVEYETADGWWTSWDTAGASDVGAVVYCEDLGSGLEIRWHTITPEQAIAATLGGGKLTAEQIMAIAGRHQPDYCSDTHVCFDWQAIADEMNATLGSGTCEPNWMLQGKTQTQEFWRCECGNCGKCFGVESRESFPFKVTIDKVDIPNFCPNCGKAVKR